MATKTTGWSGALVKLLLVWLIVAIAFSGGVAAQNATNETGNNTTTTSLGMINTTDNGTIMSNSTDATNASLAVTPPNASAPSNHTLSVMIGSDLGNFTGMTLNYSASNASLRGFGLTGVYNSTIVHADDTNYSFSDNITSSTVGFGGNSVNFTIDGFPMLNASDRVVMTYGPITNPPQPGEYNISIRLNPNATTPGPELNTSFNVTEENASLVGTTDIGVPTTTGTTTMGTNATDMAEITNDPTDISTNGNTSMATSESTQTSASRTISTEGSTTQTSAGAASATGTSGNGPGFGVAVALVALISAALLAVRR